MHPTAESNAPVVDGTGSSGRRGSVRDDRGQLMSLGGARRRRGACLAAAMFAGSALFTTSASPASAEVTECTSALAPGTYGHLVVPGGAECVLDGGETRQLVVSGNVRIEPHGELYVERATITGSIVGEDVGRIVVGRSKVGRNIVIIGGQPSDGVSPAAIGICGTEVEGNVVIHEVTAGIGLRPPRLGENMNSTMGRCGFGSRNLIRGNLIISDNRPFPLALVTNNDVEGNMRFVNNVGPGTSRVNGNQVGRTLVCAGNDNFTAQGNTSTRGPERCNTA